MSNCLKREAGKVPARRRVLLTLARRRLRFAPPTAISSPPPCRGLNGWCSAQDPVTQFIAAYSLHIRYSYIKRGNSSIGCLFYGRNLRPSSFVLRLRNRHPRIERLSDGELPVAVEQLPVYRNLPIVQVAYNVIMDGGLVTPARLRVACPDGQVERALNLLVK
jgi:hypothetical protein